MARRRLTTFSKLLITILIVAALFFGVRFFLGDTELGQRLGNQTTSGQDDAGGGDKGGGIFDGLTGGKSGDYKGDVINVGVVTWGGYAGGQYFNEGFKASNRSRFVKKCGFALNFEILDDFDASRAAFKKGDVDLLWATIDAFPTEVNGLASVDPVVLFQADWSRGGDAIVARRGITKVSDLRGKKIAVAEMTPSHSFLIWLLEAGGLTPNDVDIIPQSNAIDAAEVFKSQQVDAAVVWSPDDEGCIQAVAGSRVLESTRSASHIIADVFLAKRAWVDANPDLVQCLYEGWMQGAAEINSNDGNKRKAAKILADAFPDFTEDDTYQAINNVRLTNHGDNQNFFGLNPDYKGVTGNSLYRNMSVKYKNLGFIEGDVPSWRLIAAPGTVNSVNMSGGNQSAEDIGTFTEATEADKDKEAVATKQVRINFRTGEYQLDENAKYIIDIEFVEIAKSFANSRIRIEGNTDNVGNRQNNILLSQRRAQAVADYLAQEHGMPRNRFIIVGNGPDNPVASNNTEDGRAQNRRTDFELVAQ